MGHDENHDGDEGARVRLRSLPAVSAVLERPRVKALVEAHGHDAVVASVRAALADARAAILRGGEGAVGDDEVERRLSARCASTLKRVINAAGVVVHTNLGRAPLAPDALAAVVDVARGYSTLEYDESEGARGSRHQHAAPLLMELAGAEAAVVVNNNAGAVLLVLSALAQGREVVVSRGELVEIGGGFRIPDVMAQSGARLVEVGTTNRTRARDYAEALRAETALLLKVHRSNFALVGFTEEASLEELAALARARGVPLVLDAGSGCLLPLDVDRGEPTVREALARGADLVTFSGDKLLGGPQAGIVVGRSELVERVARHPLMRALRPDKMCLAALVATLRLWRDRPDALPVWRMLHASPDELEARARRIAREVARQGLEVRATRARVGGGASPLVELESRAVAVTVADLDALAARLRERAMPVIARIEEGALLLDLVAVHPDDDGEVARALAESLGAEGEGA